MSIKEVLMSSSTYYPHYKFLPGSSTKEYCISALLSILIDMSGFAENRLIEDRSYFMCTNEFIKKLYNLDWSDTTISDYIKSLANMSLLYIRSEKASNGHNIRFIKLNDEALIDMFRKSNQIPSNSDQILINSNQNPSISNQNLYVNNKEETIKINNSNISKDSDPVLDKKDSYIKEKELREDVVAVIDHFNSTCGTNYKATTAGTVKHIKARLNEGFSLQDLFDVIESKYAEWGVRPVRFSNGQLSNQYLRPSTLFSSKFEEYLQQAHLRSNSEGYDNKIVSTAPLEERSKEVY